MAIKVKILAMGFFWALLSMCNAQSLKGITGVRDHSYNNEKALASVKKDFPNAKLAVAKADQNGKVVFDISYCESQDRALKLDLFEPIKNINGIALIFIHGGGWRTGDKSQHHELAKELAGRGFTVITPEYRLSTEALYPSAVADVKSALTWTKSKYPNMKVAIGGFSAGGQIAAFVGATQDLEFEKNRLCALSGDVSVDAVIDVDGILAFVHPESGEGDDSHSTSAATNYFGYSKVENPELWQSAGALAHVDSTAPPYLFINSRENRMHAGREDFIAELNNHNIYSEVYTFVDAPHSFPMIDRWFLPTADLIDKFLKKVLLSR